MMDSNKTAEGDQIAQTFDFGAFFQERMGRPLPSHQTTTTEIVQIARQFGQALRDYVAGRLQITDAITVAVKLTGRDRDEVRRELDRFLTLTGADLVVALAAWSNVVMFPGGAQRAIDLASTYKLDAVTVARACLVGVADETVEDLCQIASVTGGDVFSLVCQAAQHKADADMGVLP